LPGHFEPYKFRLSVAIPRIYSGEDCGDYALRLTACGNGAGKCQFIFGKTRKASAREGSQHGAEKFLDTWGGRSRSTRSSRFKEDRKGLLWERAGVHKKSRILLHGCLTPQSTWIQISFSYKIRGSPTQSFRWKKANSAFVSSRKNASIEQYTHGMELESFPPHGEGGGVGLGTVFST